MATVIPLRREAPALAKEAARKRRPARMVVDEGSPWLAISMPLSLALVLALVCWLARL